METIINKEQQYKIVRTHKNGQCVKAVMVLIDNIPHYYYDGEILPDGTIARNLISR